MTWLLTADLHLTDRPRDGYRFGLFKWLAQQQQKHDVQATYILGDLTDRKDNHSAVLVNGIIEGLLQLKPPVYILKGNHDFIDPQLPYFKFLSSLEGVTFVTEPTLLPDWGWGAAMIPHQPNQQAFDKACEIIPPKCTLVLLHQCLEGAIAETGARLSGLQTSHISVLQAARGVWAGDVHKPQAVGRAVYVGAPYHTRFGDDFTPRVVLIGDKPVDLHFPAPRKRILRIEGPYANEIEWMGGSGDQVKVVVSLNREEITEWAACKARVLAACKVKNFEVFGIELEVTGVPSNVSESPYESIREPKQVFQAFCKAEKLPAAIRLAGAEMLEG